MHELPLVSVITPTYNHGEYITECISSVRSQSYINWEQIIIDDGSTDDTYEVAKKAIENDKRISLIRQGNKGVYRLAETYNTALSMCGGKYIAILEGDDYWESHKLEKQVKVMESEGVIATWGRAYGRVGKSKETFSIHPASDYNDTNALNNIPSGALIDALVAGFLPPLTFMIRKDALIKIGAFKQVQPFPAIDLNTFLDLSALGRFRFLDEMLGTWRITHNQTTKQKGADILNGSQKIILQHFETLSSDVLSRLKTTKKVLIDNYKKRYIVTMSRSGRFKLIRKDYVGARLDYKASVFTYGIKQPVWKLRSIIGWVFSYLHLDVEYLAKIFGKGSIKT
jgi:glycosyltransferase involved in cell wall biosynthesis